MINKPDQKMEASKINLCSVVFTDFDLLARIESAAFDKEEFYKVAFGPQRKSDEAMAFRARQMAKIPTTPGVTARYVKAVMKGEDGQEEVVGFAGWGEYLIQEGALEDQKGDSKVDEKNQNPWGPGANARLCEDVFLPADKHMLEATGRRDYASEFVYKSSVSECEVT
jgi:hypothetical protein